jgi:hypothetical protein
MPKAAKAKKPNLTASTKPYDVSKAAATTKNKAAKDTKDAPIIDKTRVYARNKYNLLSYFLHCYLAYNRKLPLASPSYQQRRPYNHPTSGRSL